MDYTRYNKTAHYADAHTLYDAGLREYFIAVYKYMAMALALTGIVAFGVSRSETLMQVLFGTPLAWLIMLAPIGMAFFMGMKIGSMSLQAAQTSFWIFASLMGLSLSTIFLAYTGESITRVFFITASLFGAMSIYGYTTKKDLTNMGSFLLMGFFGILIASIVNIFLGSSMLHFIISVLGVIIFTGLTAYDTQRIKDTYYQVAGTDIASKTAVYGALNLYMDFINLFIFLLQLIGNRR